MFEYVRYDNLRPAGTQRATKQPPAQPFGKAAVGDFVIYEATIYSTEPAYCGGVVVATTDEEGLYEVQVYAGNDSSRSWLPSWTKPKNKTKSTKSCPAGFKAWLILVPEKTIEIVGRISDKFFLTEDTLMQLRSGGFID
jgi:hypothetical protein